MHTESITCTHKGWFLLCPIYLALDSDHLTPIPKWQWLWFWLDWMLDVQQAFNWCLSWFMPEATWFMAWGVEELPQPVTLEVKCEDGEAP